VAFLLEECHTVDWNGSVGRPGCCGDVEMFVVVRLRSQINREVSPSISLQPTSPPRDERQPTLSDVTESRHTGTVTL